MMKDNDQHKFVITLLGQFGNNLFQIALAEKLESEGAIVKFDFSFVRNRTSTLDQVPYLHEYVRSRGLNYTRYLPAIGGKLDLVAILTRRVLHPKNIVFDRTSFGPDLGTLNKSAWLTGYWQQLAIAQALVPTLRESLNSGSPEKIIRVHVRRGDMVNNASALPISYFSNALQTVKQDSKFADLPVEVVSDDPKFCEEFLNFGIPFTVKHGTSALADFSSLMNAEVLICSRSTFSWWAGALSRGHIFYPTPWDPSDRKNEASVIPSDWIAMQA